MLLKKIYGQKVALENFNATFTPGIYGLLGPNGAGKSTLIKILSDVLVQTEGTVCFRGKQIHEADEQYRAVLGVVPQQQKMYEFFTGFEFMEYISALKGLNRKEAPKKIMKCLEDVELQDYADVKIEAYSGGMKQRLMLAQALLNNPKILILDEPTAGLDPRQRIILRNLIARIGMDKIVLFATHVVSDVESIAKEILLIENGKLLEYGTVEKLCNRVKGRVIEVLIKKEEIGFYESYGKIVSFLPCEGKIRVRLILEKKQEVLPQMTLVMPTLEEVYLDCFER